MPVQTYTFGNEHVKATTGEQPMARREPEPDPVGMPRDDLQRFLQSRHTVTLWPFTGRALGASRSLTYRLAATDSIRVLRLGHSYRVSSAWLEKTLFGE